MAPVPVKYSPKDKKAPALSCQLGAKSFSLPTNKIAYVDRADWEAMSRSVRFKPLIESGELSLSVKSEKVQETRQIENKEESPEPIPTLPIKPERLSPKKD